FQTGGGHEHTRQRLVAAGERRHRIGFFFSSRSRHTISKRDWSSDVCSSDLLDFGSGLEPQFFLHETQSGDRDAAAMRARAVAEPGRAFIYGPAALQVFHQVLKEKLRGDSPTHYLERRVLHRLGLRSQRYLADRAGNPLLATGWILSPRQWVK